jgi:hypothetical protein
MRSFQRVSLLPSDQLPPYLEEKIPAFVSLSAIGLWNAMGVHHVELNAIDMATGLAPNARVAVLRRKVPLQFVDWPLTSVPPSRVPFG